MNLALGGFDVPVAALNMWVFPFVIDMWLSTPIATNDL